MQAFFLVFFNFFVIFFTGSIPHFASASFGGKQTKIAKCDIVPKIFLCISIAAY